MKNTDFPEKTKQASSETEQVCSFLCPTAREPERETMNAKNAQNKPKELTPEEQALLKAYRREYARQYRAKNKERCRQNHINYELRKAREQAAAGLLDVPGVTPAPAKE